ncbi:helix-turn-helix domain-containing protein [Nocardia sp. NPDC059240]|uniref:helix-turn-helix domain-containing protein n=1 Tax=Nocardia sp. NPDC059240 TaxID=3346786 RepID=UPI0036CD2E1D
MGSTATGLPNMNPNRTGVTLRHYRCARGLSLREVAARLFCSHTWITAMESGRRLPTSRQWVDDADKLLRAGGELLAAWDADQAERAEAHATMKALKDARRESETLLVAPDGAHLDDIQDDIAQVARSSGIEAYDKSIRHALELRAELARRLRVGAHRPEEIRDLYIAYGRVSGVLAYLTLDLGQADDAHAHVTAAFTFADRADYDPLRAWAKGTESLAWRFDKKFKPAKRAAIEGLQYVGASTGTAGPRLLCGLAASTANLGDSWGAVELLERADRVRAQCGPDDLDGPLFGFSPAKQLYYWGFSLMWADEPAILRLAIKSSHEAIAAWQETKSPGDEMLTYIYLATACARLGDLDGSIEAVNPILERPLTASFSWVKKRLGQLDDLLDEHFPGSQSALEARDTIQAYIRAA